MSDKNSDGISVHAGFPNPAADSQSEELDLNRLLIKHPTSTFFMRIQGDEWQEQGIFSGDIAIVDRALAPRQTDRVIWWEAENFILSKFAKVPLNTPVWGVVVAVVHQYRQL